MTKTELQAKFDQFVKDFNNKPIKIFPNNYPPQCFEEAVKFTDILGVPHYPGNPSPFPYVNAYEIYTRPNDISKKYFDFIPNTPDYVPQKGDTVVWSGSLNGGIGHVATATGTGDTNTFQAFSQNWPLGSVAHLVTFNYNYVLGALRYKVTNSPTPPMNDEDKARLAAKGAADEFLKEAKAKGRIDNDDSRYWLLNKDDPKKFVGLLKAILAESQKPPVSVPISEADKQKYREEGRKDGLNQAKVAINKLS